MDLNELEQWIQDVEWDGGNPTHIAPASELCQLAEDMLTEWWLWRQGRGDPPAWMRELTPERLYDFVSCVVEVAEGMVYTSWVIDFEEALAYLALNSPLLGAVTAAQHFDSAAAAQQEEIDDETEVEFHADMEARRDGFLKSRDALGVDVYFPFDPDEDGPAEIEHVVEVPAPRGSPGEGWYPDPLDAGRQRRWSGGSWTDDVRAVESGARRRLAVIKPSTEVAIAPIPTDADELARALLVAALTRAIASCHNGDGPEIGSVTLDDDSYIQWGRTPSGVQLEVRAPRLMAGDGSSLDAFIERRLTEDGWLAPDGDVYVNHWLPVWDLDDCGPVADRLTALVIDVLDHQAANVLDEVRSR